MSSYRRLERKSERKISDEDKAKLSKLIRGYLKDKNLNLSPGELSILLNDISKKLKSQFDRYKKYTRAQIDRRIFAVFKSMGGKGGEDDEEDEKEEKEGKSSDKSINSRMAALLLVSGKDLDEKMSSNIKKLADLIKKDKLQEAEKFIDENIGLNTMKEIASDVMEWLQNKLNDLFEEEIESKLKQFPHPYEIFEQERFRELKKKEPTLKLSLVKNDIKKTWKQTSEINRIIYVAKHYDFKKYIKFLDKVINSGRILSDALKLDIQKYFEIMSLYSDLLETYKIRLNEYLYPITDEQKELIKLAVATEIIKGENDEKKMFKNILKNTANWLNIISPERIMVYFEEYVKEINDAKNKEEYIYTILRDSIEDLDDQIKLFITNPDFYNRLFDIDSESVRKYNAYMDMIKYYESEFQDVGKITELSPENLRIMCEDFSNDRKLSPESGEEFINMCLEFNEEKMSEYFRLSNKEKTTEFLNKLKLEAKGELGERKDEIESSIIADQMRGDINPDRLSFSGQYFLSTNLFDKFVIETLKKEVERRNKIPLTDDQKDIIEFRMRDEILDEEEKEEKEEKESNFNLEDIPLYVRTIFDEGYVDENQTSQKLTSFLEELHKKFEDELKNAEKDAFGGSKLQMKIPDKFMNILKKIIKFNVFEQYKKGIPVESKLNKKRILYVAEHNFPEDINYITPILNLIGVKELKKLTSKLIFESVIELDKTLEIKDYVNKEKEFDVKKCTNDTDLSFVDPIQMSRGLIMIATVDSKGKITDAQCYTEEEFDNITDPSEPVYHWVPAFETCCSSQSFPVFKLPHTGSWVDVKLKYLKPFNTFLLYNPTITKIGSSFAVSALHGAEENVYDVRPINREELYSVKDFKTRSAESGSVGASSDLKSIGEFHPKIEDFRRSFFPSVENFYPLKKDDGYYVGNVDSKKRRTLNGFMEDKDGKIYAGYWYDDKFVNGFVSNKDFTKIYIGTLSEKIFEEGILISPNYIYDGTFGENGEFTYGRRAERQTDIVIDGNWRDENTLEQGQIGQYVGQNPETIYEVHEETKFYNYDLIDPKLITEINKTNIDIFRFGGKEFRSKFKYIEKVDDNNYKGSLDFLSDFKNLKKIILNNFKGDLSPLKGAPISSIWMGSFTGDLSPLKEAPISIIFMDSFNGDLSALENAPISEIFMPSFTGNLDPIKDKKFSGRIGNKIYENGKIIESNLESKIPRAEKDSDSEDEGNEESEEEDEEDIDPEISNLLNEAQELIDRNR